MSIIKEFDANTAQFIKTIRDTSDELFNLKLDDETWSVADNVEHIIRSEFGMPKLFAGPDEESSHDIERNIEQMKIQFLNREKKSAAPQIVLPTNGDKNKEELITKFSSNRKKTLELVNSSNLDKTCLLYKNPVFGFVSRREWLYFSLVHCQRHQLQIDEVLNHLQKNS